MDEQSELYFLSTSIQVIMVWWQRLLFLMAYALLTLLADYPPPYRRLEPTSRLIAFSCSVGKDVLVDLPHPVRMSIVHTRGFLRVPL